MIEQSNHPMGLERRALKLVNPPAFFRKMLDATHLNSVFEVSSLKDAIQILRGRECPARYAVA